MPVPMKHVESFATNNELSESLTQWCKAERKVACMMTGNFMMSGSHKVALPQGQAGKGVRGRRWGKVLSANVLNR